ncbi:MAG: twin-arginine translocase TatA/TatE family subunit [Nitrospinales bacterium]
MMGIGFPELMIILVIIMIIFGAGKLPEIGNAFGRSIKNFKQSMKEAEQEELETEASSEATSSEESKGSEAVASEATPAEKVEGQAQAVKKAAKTEEEKMIEEAALELKEKRIGTIKTKHDGLVQQGDVFTNSLSRTPFGRGRDRGVSRDVF